MAIRSWKIEGTDGKIYTVEERLLPGRLMRPLGGGCVTVAGGMTEYVLSDGTDVLDEPEGMWTTMSGATLRKPADLQSYLWHP